MSSRDPQAEESIVRSSSSAFTVRRADRLGESIEQVAEEVPVALEYNGVSHVVMFATPSDLEDFARGFSLTEGIVHSEDEIYEISVSETQPGITVCLQIASQRFAALKGRRRSMAGRTGCGLCGTDSLAQAILPLDPVRSTAKLSAAAIAAAMGTLRADQHLMALTGAVHAAAWMDSSGRLVLVREDVGRHNALDKLIGAGVREGIDFTQGAALITSRASYEMVSKAARLNIGIVAAVSAPTALAIRMADTAGMTLLGFVRDQGYALYSDRGHLLPNVAALHHGFGDQV